MMKESFKEFIAKTKKVNGPRKHKIKNSLGIRQAFLFLQRNKWFSIGRSIKENQFQKIIRSINILLAQELIKGNEIIFPERMGILELRKYQRNAYINKEGKLVITYPIDWDATLKLWYEDSEALKNKQLIRHTHKDTVKILYNRCSANYENKMFMQFNICREIRDIIRTKLKQGQIDAYTI